MAKKRFYAVAVGNTPGIYTAWEGPDGAQAQVDGFRGARFRGFRTRAEAEAWLREAGGSRPPVVDAALSEVREPDPVPKESILARASVETARIYTDGGCIGNPGPGGYGAVLLEGGRRSELSGGFRLTTNNRMELMACIVGLTVLQARGGVRLFSDSSYVVRAMSEGWAARWRAHGWWRNKREKAENADLWGQLLSLCDEREVEFIWVRGHAGHPMNERCDELAMRAARGRDLAIDTGYEESVRSAPEQMSFA